MVTAQTQDFFNKLCHIHALKNDANPTAPVSPITTCFKDKLIHEFFGI